MSTPWAGYEPYANATLTVDIAEAPTSGPTDTGWITDPRTGNLVPSPVATGSTPSPITTLTYKCHLAPVKKAKVDSEVGVNTTSFYLEGILLYPWQFDPLIQPNQIFDAVFNGKLGKFELLPDESIRPEFKSILGTRLCGMFRMAGAGLTP